MSDFATNLKIQQEVRERINLDKWSKPFAITFKKSIIPSGDIPLIYKSFGQ